MTSDDPLIDLAAEQAVLGAILLDPVAYYEAEGVTEATFGDPRNAVVWAAVSALEARGTPVTSIPLLAGEILRAGRLNAIGGAGYLGELLDAVSTSAHVAAHASRLTGLARQRATRDTLSALAQWSGDPRRTPDEVSARVERMASELTAEGPRPEVISGGEMMDTLAGDLARRADDLAGLDTPIATLTRTINGLRPGQLILIGARPSVGKTALMIQCAIHACFGGAPVLLFSLETPKLSLAQRFASVVARVELDAVMRRRPLDTREMGLLSEAMRHLASVPLHVVDSPVQTLASIAATARRQKARGGLGLIVIDYLQLVSMAREKGRSREQDVAEVSRGLKMLAMELGVPVILLSQLSRKCEEEKRRPRLDDLRESGAIEQDADVVLFLHREGDGDPREAEDPVDLIVAKIKDGARNTVILLRYRKRVTTFREVDTDPYRAAGFPPVECQPGGDAE